MVQSSCLVATNFQHRKPRGDLILAAENASFQLPGAANGGFCRSVGQRTTHSPGVLRDRFFFGWGGSMFGMFGLTSQFATLSTFELILTRKMDDPSSPLKTTIYYIIFISTV